MKNNKQKLVVIFVALTFLLGLSTFAVAEGGKWQKKKGVQFSALGEVTAVNTAPDAGTLSLELEKANRVLKQEFELGDVVNFSVAENVQAKTEGTDQGDFDLNFFDGDIGVGATVRVLGKKTEDVYTISHIVLMIDN
jgi:ABC-type phosphate/phosphonate transport system substrate-binding protein